jgi:NADPH:quinone reductase-like Zn-dependent oxidoreductase
VDDGAFAEYIAVKGDLAMKIPKNLSDEEAATLGVGISTVVSVLDDVFLKGLLTCVGPRSISSAQASLARTIT